MKQQQQQQQPKRGPMMNVNVAMAVLVAMAVASMLPCSSSSPSSSPSPNPLASRMAHPHATCDMSEFHCISKNQSLCLPADRWCNGKEECDNRFDEPRSCSSKLCILPGYSLFIIDRLIDFYIARRETNQCREAR